MRRLLFVVLAMCLGVSGVSSGWSAGDSAAGEVGAGNGISVKTPYVNTRGEPVEILIRHVETYDLPDPVFVFELRSFGQFYGLHFETNIGDGFLEDLGGATVSYTKLLEIQCLKSAEQDCSPKTVVIRKATADWAEWLGKPNPKKKTEPVDVTSCLVSAPPVKRRFMIFKKGPLSLATKPEAGNKNKRNARKKRQEILVLHEGMPVPLTNYHGVRLTLPPEQAGRYRKIFVLTSEGASAESIDRFDEKQPFIWHGDSSWDNARPEYGSYNYSTNELTWGYHKVNGVFYDARDGSIEDSEEKPAPFPWVTLYIATGWTKSGRKVDLIPFLVEDPFTPLPLELEGKKPLPVTTVEY